MRDHEGGAITHERVHACLHELLGTRVDGARRLVEDERRRIGHGGTRDGEKLTLPCAEVTAVAGYLRVVPIRQALDEVMGRDELGRLDAFLVGGVEPSVADVLHHRPGKEMRILQHHAQRAPQLGLLDLLDVDAVVANLAVIDVVEAVDEVRDGGLASTRRTHEGNLLTRQGKEPYVVENLLLGHVAKVHAIHHEFAHEWHVGYRPLGLVRVLPRPLARAPFAFLQPAIDLPDVHQLDVTLVDLGLLGQNLQHAARTSRCLRNGTELLRNLRDGLGEGLVEREEAHERSERDDSRTHGNPRTEDGADHIAHVAQAHHHRHKHAGETVCAHGRVAQGMVALNELVDGTFLMTKHLDDLLATDRLLYEAVHLAEIILLVGEVLRSRTAYASDRQEHECHHAERQARKREREHAHGDERHHDGDAGVHELRNRLADELAQRIDVVGIDAHDVAMAVRIEVLDGQRLHVLEHLDAQRPQRSLADGHHQSVIQVGRPDSKRGDDEKPPDRRSERPVVEGGGPGIALGKHGRDVAVYERPGEERRLQHGPGAHQNAHDDETERPRVVTPHDAEDGPHVLEGVFGELRAGLVRSTWSWHGYSPSFPWVSAVVTVAASNSSANAGSKRCESGSRPMLSSSSKSAPLPTLVCTSCTSR